MILLFITYSTYSKPLSELVVAADASPVIPATILVLQIKGSVPHTIDITNPDYFFLYVAQKNEEALFVEPIWHIVKLRRSYKVLESPVTSDAQLNWR